MNDLSLSQKCSLFILFLNFFLAGKFNWDKVIHNFCMYKSHSCKVTSIPHSHHFFFNLANSLNFSFDFLKFLKRQTSYIFRDHVCNWNFLRPMHWGEICCNVAVLQVILLGIDCAIFYTNLHELFCQFILLNKLGKFW
jgi:hypothetical protein